MWCDQNRSSRRRRQRIHYRAYRYYYVTTLIFGTRLTYTMGGGHRSKVVTRAGATYVKTGSRRETIMPLTKHHFVFTIQVGRWSGDFGQSERDLLPLVFRCRPLFNYYYYYYCTTLYVYEHSN